MESYGTFKSKTIGGLNRPDGQGWEVTFEKELSSSSSYFQMRNFSYFSYNYHYKDLPQEVT